MVKIEAELIADAAEALAIAGRSARDMAGLRLVMPQADERLVQLVRDALSTWIGDTVTDVWN